MDAGWDILTQVFRLEGFVKKCLYNGFLTRSKARNVDPCRSSRDKSGVLFCCPQLVCASLLFRIWLIAIINKVATWLIALIHLVVSLFFFPHGALGSFTFGIIHQTDGSLFSIPEGVILSQVL